MRSAFQEAVIPSNQLKVPKTKQVRTHENVLTAGIRLVLEVQADQMLCEPSIVLLIDLVENEVKKVESGDQGRRKVDIPRDWPFQVVLRSDWIGSCQNGRPSIEGGDDTSFCNRDRLLFLACSDSFRLYRPIAGTGKAYHHFVQDTSSRIRHLVKLVDTAYTAITEHQSTTFQYELLGVRISRHVSRETDC